MFDPARKRDLFLPLALAAVIAFLTSPPAIGQTCSMVLVEVTVSSISLEWKECPGLTFSRLRMRGPTGTRRVIYDGPDTSYTATGLSPRTDYEFSLQVRTADGWGHIGAMVTFRTEGTPACPELPAGCPPQPCFFTPMKLDAPTGCAKRQQLATAADGDLARVEASLKVLLGEIRRRRGAGTSPAEVEHELNVTRTVLVERAGQPSSSGNTGDELVDFFKRAFGYEGATALFSQPGGYDYSTPDGKMRAAQMTEDQLADTTRVQQQALTAQSHLARARKRDAERCRSEFASAQAAYNRARAEQQSRKARLDACMQRLEGQWKICYAASRAAMEHIFIHNLDPAADCGYPMDEVQ